MPHVRAKITPMIEESTGAIVVCIDWVTVNECCEVAKDADGNEVVGHHEKFRVMPSGIGHSYVSEVGFVEATYPLSNFFIDPDGKRKFVAQAALGQVTGAGQEVALSRLAPVP